MYEYRTYHPRCRRPPDERPPRPAPLMYDGDGDLPIQGGKAPFDVHAAGNSFDMLILHCVTLGLHAHAGNPPCRITEAAERPPRRHLHYAVRRAPLQDPHPAVVREKLGPPLHVRRDRERAVQRRRDRDLVNRAHGTTARRLPPGTRGAAQPPPVCRRTTVTGKARLV